MEKILGTEFGLPFEVAITRGFPTPIGRSRSVWSQVWTQMEAGESFVVAAGFADIVGATARRLGISYVRRVTAAKDEVRFWRLHDDGTNPLVEVAQKRSEGIRGAAVECKEWLTEAVELSRGESVTLSELYAAFSKLCQSKHGIAPTEREFRPAAITLMTQIFGVCASASVLRGGKACRGFRGARLKPLGNKGRKNKGAI